MTDDFHQPDACDTMSERLATLVTTAQSISGIRDPKAKRIVLSAMQDMADTFKPKTKPKASLTVLGNSKIG